MSGATTVLERVAGHSGELVLRRGPDGLEIVANGVFLVSAANAASSRALVSAAWPHVAGGRLRVLIGGLGIGDALDEAVRCERVAEVVVVEIEPAIVGWFRRYGGAKAGRVAAGERARRARIVTADVADLLTVPGEAWDVIALDTDNGPEWLVREENAGLYSLDGMIGVREALRPGGVAVFWSPARYPRFEADLATAFAAVGTTSADDVVAGRRHEYTMYVAHRGPTDAPPRPR